MVTRGKGKKQKKQQGALCAWVNVEVRSPAACHINTKMEVAGAIPMIAIEEMEGMEAVMEGMEMVG